MIYEFHTNRAHKRSPFSVRSPPLIVFFCSVNESDIYSAGGKKLSESFIRLFLTLHQTSV